MNRDICDCGFIYYNYDHVYWHCCQCNILYCWYKYHCCKCVWCYNMLNKGNINHCCYCRGCTTINSKFIHK